DRARLRTTQLFTLNGYIYWSGVDARCEGQNCTLCIFIGRAQCQDFSIVTMSEAWQSRIAEKADRRRTSYQNNNIKWRKRANSVCDRIGYGRQVQAASSFGLSRNHRTSHQCGSAL